MRLNSSGITSVNNNYAAWLMPTAIHLARFAKISAQFRLLMFCKAAL